MVGFYQRVDEDPPWRAAHENEVPLGDEGHRPESIFYWETLFNSIARTKSNSGSS